MVDTLVRRSVWIVGGDGWAYDIGFGGLDHVLASGRNVNVLVLDTEVYSNTGGQASKATPRAAVAKFAAQGKAIAKKDLGMIAVDYGNVYVAQIAMGANPLQTLHAFQEADSYTWAVADHRLQPLHRPWHRDVHLDEPPERGGSQRLLAPLPLRPAARPARGAHPFHLDSHKPHLPFKDFAMKEARFAMLTRSNPERAEQLLSLAQRDIDERWHFYEQMAGVERTAPWADGRGASMNVDLTTRYLGLALANPLVISACSLTGKLDTLRRLEDAGAAAAVMPSLFEEQIEHDEMAIDRFYEHGAESFPEALSYFPELNDYNTGPDAYLRPHRGGQAVALHSGDRQLERHVEGRMGSSTAADPGCRCRCPRTECLRRRHRSQLDRRRRRIALRRASPGSSTRSSRSPSPSSWGRSSRTAQHGAPADPGRRERPGLVQPLPPAGHRPGDAARGSEPGPEHEQRAAPAAAVDRHPPRPL